MGLPSILTNFWSLRNITLSRRMAPASWELVHHVLNEFPESESKGDFLEAIVVAVDHLRQVISGGCILHAL